MDPLDHLLRSAGRKLRLKPDGPDAVVEVIAYEQHVIAKETQPVGLVEPSGCGRTAVPGIAGILAAGYGFDCSAGGDPTYAIVH